MTQDAEHSKDPEILQIVRESISGETREVVQLRAWGSRPRVSEGSRTAGTSGLDLLAEAREELNKIILDLAEGRMARSQANGRIKSVRETLEAAETAFGSEAGAE